jgi:hypothetical protein
MSTTRRQHYVWKHYLRNWERFGTVTVLRKGAGRAFATDAANVAVMRDFYRLPYLSEEDENFIERFIDSTHTSDLLKKLNRGWLTTIAAPSRLRRLITQAGALDPGIEAEIERIEIQFEENMHGRIESDAVRLIEALNSGRAEIWSDDDDARDLAYFLSLQHLRTKKMRDNFLGGIPEGPMRAAAERCWPILRHILATNLGWSLFSDRANWSLTVLRPTGTIDFIAGDQPTLNLLRPDTHNSLALYYPVGPRAAALLEHRENESVVGNEDHVSDSVVRMPMLNSRIFDFSLEQVFGTDGGYLETLAAPPPTAA